MKFVVTGGAGFIGSNAVRGLNEDGWDDIIVADHLREDKRRNLAGLRFGAYYDADDFLTKLEAGAVGGFGVIIHLGARTDTTETDRGFLLRNNLDYSKRLYEWCCRNACRFIYASSASVYGDGSHGYREDTWDLTPLNYYAESKLLFDQWVKDRPERPPQWVGLRFFNVYGPNEYHKGPMASVMLHGFEQIRDSGEIRLFRSDRPEYRDGEQLRDFVYVKDIVSIIRFLLAHPEVNGIYNTGTGKARTFNALGEALFAALGRPTNIRYIDFPAKLKGKYQYFTEADMTKLHAAGYAEPPSELEDGIRDYVQNYLLKAAPAD